MTRPISTPDGDAPPVTAGPAPGAEFETLVEDLNAAGAGVSRVQGLVVFTPGAAPGDRAVVRLKRIRRGWGEGELLRIVSPSPHRREPPCPHQRECGGCPLMIIDETTALAVKARHLGEVLRRIGKVDRPLDRVIPSPLALGYRGRVRFAVAPWRAGAWFGYHPQGRPQTIVPVVECRLAPPRASALARDFVDSLHRLTGPSTRVWPTHLSVRGALARGRWLLVPHTGEGSWREGEAVAREMLARNADLAGVVRLIEAAGRPVRERTLAGDAVVVE